MQVINEALIEMGTNIHTIPENCRHGYGSMITARVKIYLKKPLHRGDWRNTTAGGVTWVRYLWERQPHSLCPNCFVIDHDEEECANVAEDLKIRRYTNDEYINYCNNLDTQYGVEIIDDLDLMLKQICGASIRKINAEKEEHEEERRTKRSRGDDSSNVSSSNCPQGTGNTTLYGDIDGMDHDLAEEGDQNAREIFHGMNEASANLVPH